MATGARKQGAGSCQPPSRARYEQSHPVISFRVNREVYQRLQELLQKSGKSIGDLFREALGVQAASAGNAHQKGYTKGYEDAKGRYLVTYRCSVCGQIIEMTTANEKAAAAQLMREDKWAHGACVQKSRR